MTAGLGGRRKEIGMRVGACNHVAGQRLCEACQMHNKMRDLLAIEKAARNLLKVKGRFHTEIALIALENTIKGVDERNSMPNA